MAAAVAPQRPAPQPLPRGVKVWARDLAGPRPDTWAPVAAGPCRECGDARGALPAPPALSVTPRRAACRPVAMETPYLGGRRGRRNRLSGLGAARGARLQVSGGALRGGDELRVRRPAR